MHSAMGAHLDFMSTRRPIKWLLMSCQASGKLQVIQSFPFSHDTGFREPLDLRSNDSRPMGEYPILEGYSTNFQQLSMRPFDLGSKGCQQPVSWLRLPRPSPYSRSRALGDLTRCVRLSDVGMSYIVIT